MKRLAFIAIFGVSSVYFVGCGIGGDSLESKNIDSSKGYSVESKNTDSTKTPTLSSKDYSHLPECRSDEDFIKGCIHKNYRFDGSVWFETPYKDGKINGVAKSYHRNGKLFTETPFKNDKKEGEMKQYHEDGSLWFSIVSENDEIKSGKCSDGMEIDTQTLREFFKEKLWDTSVLGCD